jgi:hypothetical protein
MDSDYEEYLDAIISHREKHPWCEVCDKCVKFDTCDHPKNGYCALFRLQAKKDSKEFNMKGSHGKDV